MSTQAIKIIITINNNNLLTSKNFPDSKLTMVLTEAEMRVRKTYNEHVRKLRTADALEKKANKILEQSVHKRVEALKHIGQITEEHMELSKEHEMRREHRARHRARNIRAGRAPPGKKVHGPTEEHPYYHYFTGAKGKRRAHEVKNPHIRQVKRHRKGKSSEVAGMYEGIHL